MSGSTRRGTVALVSTAALVVLALAVRAPLAEATGALRAGTVARTGFDDLLVWLCAGAAVPAAGCWWVGTLRLVAATRPGTSTAAPHPAGVPRWWRRVVLAACGATLLTGPVAPSVASGERVEPAPTALTGTLPAATGDLPATGPDGLPLPDRVAGTTRLPGAAPGPGTPVPPTARALAPPAAGPTAPAVVRVLPGDSLWRIAETHLRRTGDPHPTAADVAVHWRAIHAANGALIGPDPDLLLPGLRLRLPPPT